MDIEMDLSVYHVNDFEGALIVYDGDCIFCSRSMDWIVRHDTYDNIRMTACTSEMGARLMRKHGIDPSDPSTFLVLKNGRAYTRSAAMLELLPLLDKSIQGMKVFRYIPGPVRDMIYNWTARNRRKLVQGSCPVPTPAMMDRMV
jgi:predicted DCC family thiol-disulfide oxidoreductase YuxK